MPELSSDFPNDEPGNLEPAAKTSASERTEQTEAPPDETVLAAWDETLQALWDPGLERALNAAGQLFAPEPDRNELPPRLEEHISVEFWRRLTGRQSQMPRQAAGRYQGAVAALWRLLRDLRETPGAPFIEEHLAVALRAVRRLQAGQLTPEICAALYDFHRGWWLIHLSRPQLWTLRTALAQTLAALPAESMEPFWDGLNSRDPMLQRAMSLGLDFLRKAHAVPHLLHGMEHSRDHAARVAILECLEQICDPRALDTLGRLCRETALSDWTLSRQITRTIRVIERQNPGSQYRTLLRAVETPSEKAKLLRPALENPDAAQRARDQQTLPRPTPPPPK